VNLVEKERKQLVWVYLARESKGVPSYIGTTDVTSWPNPMVNPVISPVVSMDRVASQAKYMAGVLTV